MEKIVTREEMSRTIDARSPYVRTGTAGLLKMMDREVLLWRFDLSGRLTYGGAVYVRAGGPDRTMVKSANDCADLYRAARQAWELNPDGYVVVTELMQPWCAVRKGLSPYRPGGTAFVFADQSDAESFAVRINGRQRKEDFDAIYVSVLSTVAFAKKARGMTELFSKTEG